MDRTIRAFRAFNRFHTQFVGLLNKRLLDSPLGLAEARALYEIAATPSLSAADLARRLGMDKGQLSRIISLLRKRGLIERPDKPTGRAPLPLSPSPLGRELLRDLEASADAQARRLLQPLDRERLDQLRQAMDAIRSLLRPDAAESTGQDDKVLVREAKSGELGWIITQHAEIYEREYGFSGAFEEYVLLGMASYLRNRNPRSRVWVAEWNERPAGSIAIVEHSAREAQLRWFLVHPSARRLGLGRALLDQAVAFGRERAFDEIFLWTLAHLASARKMYAANGFRLAAEQSGLMGGQPVVEEKWVLELNAGRETDENAPA